MCVSQVSELNRTATQLFESGDMAGYTQLINRLATDGFLNPEEVIQLATAAQEHANGLGGQAGDSTQGASTQETITGETTKTLVSSVCVCVCVCVCVSTCALGISIKHLLFKHIPYCSIIFGNLVNGFLTKYRTLNNFSCNLRLLSGLQQQR